MGRKKSSSGGWPGFDSSLLGDIAAAFLRRRKALAYSAALSCLREWSEGPDGATERLDFTRRDCLGQILQLSVWADGRLWVAVSVPGRGRNAGWAFADRFTGTALDVGPATLLGMVESTVAGTFEADPAAGREKLRAIWARVSPQTA